jgi:hypothetical protein
MGARCTRNRCLGVFPAIVFCLLGIPAASPAQGKFPVEEGDITAMKLNHYYGPDNKLREADFTWSFEREAFTLKKGKASIPDDLLEKLLPGGATADEIRGKWALRSGRLLLTEVRAGKQGGRKEVTLSVYKTAAGVVRLGYGAPQYVFTIER